MSRASFCMAFAFLACLLVAPTGTQAWNAGANGTLAVGASAFNKVFAAAIPIIEKVGPTITIGPLSGTHYSVGTFHLNDLVIGDLVVSFVAPNQLKVDITGLDLSIPSTPFKVFAKIFEGEEVFGHEIGPDFKISCSGHLSGGVKGATATLGISLSTNAAGKLVGTVNEPVVDVGNPSVSVDMHGLCKVADDIIDLFKKLVVKELKKEADKLLPKKIESIFQKLMTNDLPKLPLKFASQPKVVSDHMELDAQLLAPSLGLVGGALVSNQVTPLVQPHIFTDRDISIGINTPSFDDFIAAAADNNGFDFEHTFSGKYNTSIFALFVPAAYAKCPDCPFGASFAIQPNSPPTAIFGSDALEFAFNNVVLNFTAVPAGLVEENLFSAFANLSFGLTNFTVFDDGTKTLVNFNVALNDFSMHLGQSFLGHIHLSKFSHLLEDVVKDLVVPLFNAGFKGFPLDLEKDGFGLDQWKVDLHQDAITLGANLLLPNQMGVMRALLRGKL